MEVVEENPVDEGKSVDDANVPIVEKDASEIMPGVAADADADAIVDTSSSDLDTSGASFVSTCDAASSCSSCHRCRRAASRESRRRSCLA